jgi:hypothetical protein
MDDEDLEEMAGTAGREDGSKKLIQYASFRSHGLSPAFGYLRCSNAATS